VRGPTLLHWVWPKTRNLTSRANHFSFAFNRKSLGHRNYQSFGIVRFNIRESFAGADRASEFRFTGHISDIRRSFRLADRARDQPVGWDPSGIPGFEGHSTKFTLKTVNFASLRHAFGAAIDRSAFAGSMARF
jgi:hypothetical protein